MNQIAIGDETAWVVLDGASIAAPHKTAAAFFTFSADPFVKEHIEIHLAGTAAQVSTALAALETIIHRAQSHQAGAYPYPQYLRFQQAAGGAYFYAQFSQAYLAANPAAYKTRQTGSVILSLHYTRPNFFDGPKTELPLTTKGYTDVTGGVTINNHTCNDVAHSNTVLIKPADCPTELPAPLRLELKNTINSGGQLIDIHYGIYHHPNNTNDEPFFYHGSDLAGGTVYADAAAINGYYNRFVWSATAWTALCSIAISATDINILDGRLNRPILRIFNAFAYTDLYLKFQITRGTDVLFDSETVYADPTYRHVFFPPINLPPTRLLKETLPHSLTLVFYVRKTSGASYTLDIDQVCLQPLDYSAEFLGFFGMNYEDWHIYDSHRGLHNVLYSAVGSETVAHVITGGPLLLWPGAYTRLFTVMVADTGRIHKDRTALIKAYYRKRVRLL